MDAFAHIIFPYTQEIWPTKLSPVGALKDTVLSGFKNPLPPYITVDDLEAWKATNATNGWTASMCWYKVMVSGLDFKDDASAYLSLVRTSLSSALLSRPHFSLVRTSLSSALLSRPHSRFRTQAVTDASSPNPRIYAHTRT